MKQVFYGLLLFASGFTCGFYLNNQQPQVIRVPVGGTDESHIHFNNVETVFLQMDGKKFRLEVDGEWTGITLVEEVIVKDIKGNPK